MTQHILQGRSETEALWFQRRSFVQAAATWTVMGGFGAAQAQRRSNIVELRGDVLLNGGRMDRHHTIQTGDNVETGPSSHLVFVIGDTAFQMRQNSRLTVERGATLNSVSVLRLLTGAVASVWGRGTSRQIVTPTLTAGIRGTGVYTEVFPQQNFRSYFCNCWGEVELGVGPDKIVSSADYHQSFWGEREAEDGRFLRPAKAINHTDEELEYLAQLVGQRAAWQVAGKNGVQGGSGYMDPRPPALSSTK